MGSRPEMRVMSVAILASRSAKKQCHRDVLRGETNTPDDMRGYKRASFFLPRGINSLMRCLLRACKKELEHYVDAMSTHQKNVRVFSKFSPTAGMVTHCSDVCYTLFR